MKRKPGCEFEHFQGRMLERYGVDVDMNDYHDLNLMIQAGEARFIHNESMDQQIYEVEFGRDPLTILVVYSRKREKITTALPPDSWKMPR